MKKFKQLKRQNGTLTKRLTGPIGDFHFEIGRWDANFKLKLFFLFKN